MRQDHIVTQTEEMRGNLQQSSTPKDVRWSDSSNDGRSVRQQLISGYTVLNLQRRESDLECITTSLGKAKKAGNYITILVLLQLL